MIKGWLNALADITASLVILSLVAFIAAALIGVYEATFSNVGLSWYGLYAFIVIMSATKLYGRGVYNTVKDLGLGLLNINPRNVDNGSNGKDN